MDEHNDNYANERCERDPDGGEVVKVDPSGKVISRKGKDTNKNKEKHPKKKKGKKYVEVLAGHGKKANGVWDACYLSCFPLRGDALANLVGYVDANPGSSVLVIECRNAKDTGNIPPGQTGDSTPVTIKRLLKDKEAKVLGYDVDVCTEETEGPDPYENDPDADPKKPKPREGADKKPVTAQPKEIPPEPDWRRQAQPVPPAPVPPNRK